VHGTLRWVKPKVIKTYPAKTWTKRKNTFHDGVVLSIRSLIFTDCNSWTSLPKDFRWVCLFVVLWVLYKGQKQGSVPLWTRRRVSERHRTTVGTGVHPSTWSCCRPGWSSIWAGRRHERPAMRYRVGETQNAAEEMCNILNQNTKLKRGARHLCKLFVSVVGVLLWKIKRIRTKLTGSVFYNI